MPFIFINNTDIIFYDQNLNLLKSFNYIWILFIGYHLINKLFYFTITSLQLTLFIAC